MSFLYYPGQSIAEILSDSVTMMVMEADGIDAKELETTLRLVAQNSPAVSAGFGSGLLGGDDANSPLRPGSQLEVGEGMSRRILQLVTAVLGLIPVVTGIVAMAGVDDPLYASLGLPRSPLLDSNLRFFAGVWTGFGIALLWLVPSIERQTALFRAIWGAVFLGGVGRLLSVLLVGFPPIPFLGFTALEIIGAPLFIYWQEKVARFHSRNEAS
jgi:hypothetical protein